MPHPCQVDATLEGCAELVVQHTTEVTTLALDLKSAMIANAPVIAERLNNAMIKVGEWVEATETFALEQALFLVQEIIWWGVLSSGYWIVLGFIAMSVWPLSLLYLRRSSKLKQYENKFSAALGEKGSGIDCAVAIVGGFAFPILGFLLIGGNIMKTLKPLVTPRLYLIEYFQELVK